MKVMTVRRLILLLTVCIVFGCGKDAEHHVKEGNAYLRRGDMANAILQFERAVEADPDHYEAHNSLGATLSAIGDFERAIDHFRAAVAINREFVEGHYNLGRAYTELGRYQDALPEFNIVLALDSTYALAYLSAGDIFANQGLSEQAIDSYKRAIRHDPNMMPAYMRLASVYNGIEEFDEGIGLLLRASVVQPRNAEIISMAGRMAIRKRDFERAVGLLNEAVGLDSLNPIYRNDLATALMLAERKDEAIIQWEWVLARNPDPNLEAVVRQNLKRARSQ